jgi:hypothetical protein
MSIPTKTQIKSILNKGLVNESNKTNKTNNVIEKRLYNKLGEFVDVLAVAYKLKPLAALDFTPYGRVKFKKLDMVLINKVIEFCNELGVKHIHHTKTGGMYLKSIFFLPENYQSAVNLMYILWMNPTLSDNPILNNMFHHFYIGKSLGYLEKNIQIFLNRNLNTTLTSTQLEIINKLIETDSYTIDDFSTLKIKVKDTIKPL